MRQQVVEVVQVALESLLDLAELFGAALQISGRGADRARPAVRRAAGTRS